MRSDEQTVVEEETDDASAEPVDFDSVVLERLIGEVRAGEPVLTGGHYDRVHNRHNR